MSDGHYKHVIGRPIFRGEKEDNISMAFLYTTQNTKNNFQTNRGRTISLGQQAILAIILTLVYHVLIYVNKIFWRSQRLVNLSDLHQIKSHVDQIHPFQVHLCLY